MTGVVAAKGGKAVPGAFVLVRDYQQANQDYIGQEWETRTDAGGTFSPRDRTGLL
jgi:hypothetical protein